MWRGMELVLTIVVESLAALGFPGRKAREEKWRRKMAAKKVAEKVTRKATAERGARR